MKYVGFIREHDPLPEVIDLRNLLGNTSNDPSLVKKVVKYLNRGTAILEMMGYHEDRADGGLIGPICYFTDGEYIWPSYFSYYLKKYSNYILDEEFIRYLTSKRFRYGWRRFDRDKIEKELDIKLRGRVWCLDGSKIILKINDERIE